MKLKRPNATINNGKLVNSLPEVMDFLEWQYWALAPTNKDGTYLTMAYQIAHEKCRDLMLKMGYTQEEELPEPETQPTES